MFILWAASVGRIWSFVLALMTQLSKFGTLFDVRKNAHYLVMSFVAIDIFGHLKSTIPTKFMWGRILTYWHTFFWVCKYSILAFFRCLDKFWARMSVSYCVLYVNFSVKLHASCWKCFDLFVCIFANGLPLHVGKRKPVGTWSCSLRSTTQACQHGVLHKIMTRHSKDT